MESLLPCSLGNFHKMPQFLQFLCPGVVVSYHAIALPTELILCPFTNLSIYNNDFFLLNNNQCVSHGILLYLGHLMFSKGSCCHFYQRDIFPLTDCQMDGICEQIPSPPKGFLVQTEFVVSTSVSRANMGFWPDLGNGLIILNWIL